MKLTNQISEQQSKWIVIRGLVLVLLGIALMWYGAGSSAPYWMGFLGVISFFIGVPILIYGILEYIKTGKKPLR
ncbi:MAG: hypothetical protein AAB541_01185 [Patescibacteria group bacterium]